MHYVYILQCKDGTLYAGATVDLQQRLRKHNGEVVGGAKYTRARRPVEYVYTQECLDFAESRAREAEIKRMSREDKLVLVASYRLRK